mgnify:CR=1 FL=1
MSRYVIFYARCPKCARVCALHSPAGGDGSGRITYWHKRLGSNGSEWCRSEVNGTWHRTRAEAAAEKADR